MGLHTMTDHSISEKIEYKYLSFINKVFLVVHIGFLLLFANLKINFMVYFNLGSILFYTLAFFMLQKFKIHLYVYLASIEILLHMSAATLCVGLGCNFQLCLFGVILFFFIIECILPDKKKSITPVLILSSLYSVAIVALYVAGNRISPFYPLSLTETGILAVVIVIFVLLLIITSMLFLLRYMVHEEEKLTKKAEYDALTGIPNRFFMMDEIQKLFIENGQKDYYLAMIDIDNFKNINDTYGHNTGDDALKILAKTIILQAQKHGFKYCRWGGEEFLLLGKCRSGEIPKDILEELRSAISSNCVRTSRESFRYTVTIGAGKYTSGQSAKEWLDFVDKQLYKGKRSGLDDVGKRQQRHQVQPLLRGDHDGHGRQPVCQNDRQFDAGHPGIGQPLHRDLLDEGDGRYRGLRTEIQLHGTPEGTALQVPRHGRDGRYPEEFRRSDRHGRTGPQHDLRLHRGLVGAPQRHLGCQQADRDMGSLGTDRSRGLGPHHRLRRDGHLGLDRGREPHRRRDPARLLRHRMCGAAKQLHARHQLRHEQVRRLHERLFEERALRR